MKKIILIFSLISILFLTGCSSNEIIENEKMLENNNETDLLEGISGEEENETITNKFIVIKNIPITYTTNDDNISQSDFGRYSTYETIYIDNPNDDKSINKINQFLNAWKLRITEDEYEVAFPENVEHIESFNYSYSEFYQNENVFVIKELYSGVSGGGAANASIIYHVFDKNTGDRLELKDISNDSDKLMEYLFYKPVADDADMINSWWDIGMEGDLSLPKNLEDYRMYFEGTWAIDQDGIVISRSSTLSGPIFTLKYNLNDITNELHNNIKDEYFR